MPTSTQTTDMTASDLLTQLRADRENLIKLWRETCIIGVINPLSRELADLDTTIKVILKYVK